MHEMKNRMSQAVEVLMLAHDPLTIMSRSSSEDYERLKSWSHQILIQGYTMLRISDTRAGYSDFESSEVMYLNQSEKSPIEVAYALTLLLVIDSFSVVILDGCLVDLSEYYPRLRWVLARYQTSLVIFKD